MNAPHVAEAPRDYLTQLALPLVRHFDLLAGAPQGVARLRELILSLAVRGKLVPQDPTDEPASALLERIRVEKDRLIAEGKIKQDKSLAAIEEAPFALPDSWTWVLAAELCSVITDGDHQPPPKADQGVPFLVIGDVRTGSVDLTEASRFVPHSYFDALDWGKKPQAGDVLYTTVGSFGIPVPIKEVMHFCFQRHIALFRPGIAELQGFLHLVLQSNHAFEQAEAGATGTAQKTVPLSVLRGLTVPLPPLAEQARIVAKVEELMTLCDLLEEKGRLEAEQHRRLVATLFDSLTSAESAHELAESWQRISAHFDLLLDRPEAVDVLEQTVLQLAVRGLLVPQDPADEPASRLLERIRSEKDRLIAAGKIKRDKPLPSLGEDERPFEVPEGWAWERFGAVITGSEAGWSPSCSNVPRTGTNWGVLKVSAVSWGEFRSQENKELPADLPSRPEYEVLPGDFLISRANTEELVARSAIARTPEPKLMLSDKVVRVHLSEYVCREYLNLNNNSTWARSYYAANASGTSSSMKNVSREVIMQLPVPFPPLAEQSRIVARVEELRRLCADLRGRLNHRKEIQRALSAALVEQVAA